MNITHGRGRTCDGPGVRIDLTADEAAMAIDAWLVARGVNVQGPRTVYVNGELLESANVYVDPSGWVGTPEGETVYGRG